MSEIEDFEEGYADATESVGTLRVGKQTYAIALIWQEADDDADLAQSARAVAADPTVNGDFFVLRPQSRQFGVGLKDRGHAKNLPSLAAQLADARRGTRASWVGVFEAEGGFYVLAVRDELILGRTDRFYTDEMAARTEISHLMDLDAWGEIFAPDAWEVEGAKEKTLQELTAGSKAPRLRGTDRMDGKGRWLIAAALLLALVGGGVWYQQYLADIEAEQVAADLAEMAKKNLPLAGMQEAPRPPMPWEDRPIAVKYLAACMDGMHKAVLDFPGWTASKIECNGDAAVRLDITRTATLESGGGTVNWIRWTLDRSPTMSKAMIVPTGNDAAQISWSTDKVETYAPALNPKAPDLAKVKFYLQSWFEEAFTTIEFPKAQGTDFYRTMSFKFSTTYEPTRFSQIIERVPGLTIDKVTADLKKLPLTYVVEGQIHEELAGPNKPKRGPRPRPDAAAPANAPATGPTAAAAAPQPRT